MNTPEIAQQVIRALRSLHLNRAMTAYWSVDAIRDEGFAAADAPRRDQIEDVLDRLRHANLVESRKPRAPGMRPDWRATKFFVEIMEGPNLTSRRPAA